MIYFNNEWREDMQSARILSFLTTGQAVFETIFYEDGRLWFWERHQQRLQRTLQFFNCEYLGPDLHEIMLRRLRQRDNIRQARVKLVLLIPFLEVAPRLDSSHVVIQIDPLPKDVPAPQTPLKLWPTAAPFSAGNELVHHKTSNYGFHFYYLKRAQALGFDDVLYLDEQGNFLETSRANIFAVQGQQIFTPPLKAGILPGTVRSVLCDFLAVQEAPLALSQLTAYDFCFLSGSVRELRPVHQIGEHPFQLDTARFSRIVAQWENIKNRYIANQIK